MLLGEIPDLVVNWKSPEFRFAASRLRSSSLNAQSAACRGIYMDLFFNDGIQINLKAFIAEAL
jgi:hypothetical protein